MRGLWVVVLLAMAVPASEGFRSTPPVTMRASSPAPAPTPPLQSTPPLRVGLLVEPTPFTHVSGYANRFNEMLRYLREAGDNVEVVTPDPEPEQAPKRRFGFKINNIRGFRLPLYKLVLISFDFGGNALRAMQRFRPQLIHVTTPSVFVFAGWITSRLLKIPLVMSYHTHLPVYAARYLRVPWMGWKIPGVVTACWSTIRWLHNKADLTLVTSPQMQQELQSQGVQNVQVWRKGIDTDTFHPKFRKRTEMRKALTDNHPNAPLMMYVGRLGSEKRIDDLKDVLSHLPRNTRLAIVGGGPHEEALREHFAGTKTVFAGMLHGEELSEAFASADVFCMPSDSETLGFVVLESMASGVPVVGVNAGGVPNLIRDGETGFLVEPGDTKAFAERVRRLLTSEKLRRSMATAARDEAEQWDWKSATSQLRNEQYQAAMRNFQARVKEISDSAVWTALRKWWRIDDRTTDSDTVAPTAATSADAAHACSAADPAPPKQRQWGWGGAWIQTMFGGFNPAVMY